MLGRVDIQPKTAQALRGYATLCIAHHVIIVDNTMILNSAVERMHMVQALDSPGESEESLITNKVIAFSSDSPCKPISYTSRIRSTAEFRMIGSLVCQECLGGD